MEPRPQRPSRATGPYISTGTPSPSSGTPGSYGSGAYDASSAPPAPPPAIGYDPDYSPGQPLTPLRGPRGANIVGPLLAVAALAIIVAAVAFIVSQFRGDGDDNTGVPTVSAALAGTPDDEDVEVGANGEDDAATETPSDTDADSPTEEAADNDEEDAEPTRTPRVNRPTETDEDLAAGSDDEETTADDETEPKTRARQWLPTEGEIGEGFAQTENGSRGLDEVVASFPPDDSENVSAQLTESGWEENVFRNFASDAAGDADVYAISISVHRFSSEQGAKDALPLFAEGGRVGQGLSEVDADRLGEGSIVLQGTIEGGNIYVIYVRQDEFIFRIGGLSRAGDPAEFTTDIANLILES